MSDEQPPEADRLAGAPHPRETTTLFGQDAAEAEFLDAIRRDRLPHAWLLTGPRGIGKATLAWRIARFLLATPAGAPTPSTLDIPADDPVARRLRAGSEARLFLLRRPWDAERKRLKTEITVDEARKLKSFFALSSPDGGYRVVIVDAAEEMNPSAANAILKILEEPPERCVLLLVSHSPAGLLPTIRSRCRTLRCRALAPGDLAAALAGVGVAPDDPAALSELAGGSAGDAIGLMQEDGLALYADLVALVGAAPDMDRPRLVKLADAAGARTSTARRDLTLRLIDTLLARMARGGVTASKGPEAAPSEAAMIARLVPDPRAARRWAELQQDLSDRARHAIAVNLDPSGVILDMLLRINETAGTIRARV